MKQILKLSIITALVLGAQVSMAATPILDCIGKVNQSLGVDGEAPKVLVGQLAGGRNQSYKCELTLATTEEKNSVYLTLEARDESNANELISGNKILLFDPVYDESLVKMKLARCEVGQNISVQFSEIQSQGFKQTSNNAFKIERSSDGRITSVTVLSETSTGKGSATICNFN